jgi:hypothetical protein
MKKEDNLGVPNLHWRPKVFKEIVCDCVNWIQLCNNRDQEQIPFEHYNGFSVYVCNFLTSRATVSFWKTLVLGVVITTNFTGQLVQVGTRLGW